MSLCPKRANLHVQLGWSLMKTREDSCNANMLGSFRLTVSCIQSFRSSKYQFIKTKRGISEVTLTVGPSINR